MEGLILFFQKVSISSNELSVWKLSGRAVQKARRVCSIWNYYMQQLDSATGYDYVNTL